MARIRGATTGFSLAGGKLKAVVAAVHGGGRFEGDVLVGLLDYFVAI